MAAWGWLFRYSFGAAAEPAVYVIDGAGAQILKRDIQKGAAATSATRVLPPREDARGRRLGAGATLARLAVTVGGGMRASGVGWVLRALAPAIPVGVHDGGGRPKGDLCAAS